MGKLGSLSVFAGGRGAKIEDSREMCASIAVHANNVYLVLLGPITGIEQHLAPCPTPIKTGSSNSDHPLEGTIAVAYSHVRISNQCYSGVVPRAVSQACWVAMSWVQGLITAEALASR